MHAPLPSRLALAALALLAGCAGESTPHWVPLARGFQPSSLLARAREWQRTAGLDPARCREVPFAVEIEHTLTRADWRAEGDGLWSAAIPGGAFAHGAPHSLRLELGETVVPAAPGPALTPGTFREDGARVLLCLPALAEPPAEVLLAQHLVHGRQASDGVWQVHSAGELDAGIPIWSGSSETLRFDLAARSRLQATLRFTSRAAHGEVRLRLRLGDELVHELVADAAELAAGRALDVLLPRQARAGAALSLALEGPPGLALLQHPIVGPAEFGTYGQRPWVETRPDMVLFLADTFRADNLALAGGAPELTPRLNRFAEDALRFREARSVAAWTLPSISTLLSGLAPGQHTANETSSALPDALTTVVESLSRAGYRTVAVTDAAFFTPIHGLDQGFEVFAYNFPSNWKLDWTLARAREFLGQDDGRPLFLLVHSYRAHMPYRTGPDEDLAGWVALRAAGCALMETREELAPEEWRARLESCRGELRRLYLAGVRDLDRGFGALLDLLAEHRLGGRAHVFFTSDHGEALGENADVFHGGPLWEAKLRIPLLLAGPGLGARDVDAPVTLLDLAPTLAELAGLPRDPRWPGTSLLTAPPARPSFAFRLQKTSQITLIEAGRKLSLRQAGDFELGRVEAAYDLLQDPGEEHDLAAEAWVAELARAHAAAVRTLLAPAAEPQGSAGGSEHQRELDQLGYGGERER